ncbi:high mobility group box domain-containing protein [Phanerochaete sordida]|uniref:High mobility group box domain-containing protein n=1 Tax=Phanerochaete sordida TaxID=48140 RepID=A0A9P3G5S1_9APHY|nr:high mobility group box domain-containing protein [Phanerochaete sordida]
MVKTVTETRSKGATKTAVEGKTKSKSTRAPSAYNLWMKDNLKKYKEDHPNVAQKDIMKAVGALWKDAPENPRRGQEPKPKAAKKAPQAKSRKPGDETATSEPEPSSDD